MRERKSEREREKKRERERERELYLMFSSRAPCLQLSLHCHCSFVAQTQGHRPYVQLIEPTPFPNRHGLVCLSSIEMLPLQTLEPASWDDPKVASWIALVQNRHAPFLIWALCDSRFSASCKPHMVCVETYEHLAL